MLYFSGFYTNHSLRATCATRLYSAGVDEQLIMERTGHKSNSVRQYKRTNDGQIKTVSDILQDVVNSKPASQDSGVGSVSKNNMNITINATGNVTLKMN